MGFFDRTGPKKATQEDAELIRDGLVLVIQSLAGRATRTMSEESKICPSDWNASRPQAALRRS